MRLIIKLRILLVVALLSVIACSSRAQSIPASSWVNPTPTPQNDRYDRRTGQQTQRQGTNNYDHNNCPTPNPTHSNEVPSHPSPVNNASSVVNNTDRLQMNGETTPTFSNKNNASYHHQSSMVESRTDPPTTTTDRHGRTGQNGWQISGNLNNGQSDNYQNKTRNRKDNDELQIGISTKRPRKGQKKARATTTTTPVPLLLDEEDAYYYQEFSDDEEDPHSSLPVGSILFKNSSLITFVTSNKTAEPVPLPVSGSNVHLITGRTEYSRNNGKQLLQMSSVPSRTSPSLGFIQTVTFAYKNHHNLVLRPDDVWTALMVQFSIYLNTHAERYRSRLVNHTGKAPLNVKLSTGGLYSQNYDSFVTEMSSLILSTVKTPWIIGNFTTTTPTDRIVGGVVLMASMQKYFDYKFEIGCGIPEITLLGTVEDWKDILKRTKRFDNFGPQMMAWRSMLKPILTQFIQAKSGQIDVPFWTDIVRLSANYVGKQDALIDGWITAFSVFDNEGKWQGELEEGKSWPKIDVEKWAPGVVTVPLVIQESRGHEHAAFLLAGHLGQTTTLQGGSTLQPYSGWGIALK